MLTKLTLISEVYLIHFIKIPHFQELIEINGNLNFSKV
jgi:hypothetical protein